MALAYVPAAFAGHRLSVILAGLLIGVHRLIGTPEIAATIAVPWSVSTGYAHPLRRRAARRTAPSMAEELDNRRPIRRARRRLGAPRRLAKLAAEADTSPDLISAASAAFAALGAAAAARRGHGAALATARRRCWSAQPRAIQLRLVFNLIDGMVAVEHDPQGAGRSRSGTNCPTGSPTSMLLAEAGYSVAASGVPFGVEVSAGPARRWR